MVVRAKLLVVALVVGLIALAAWLLATGGHVRGVERRTASLASNSKEAITSTHSEPHVLAPALRTPIPIEEEGKAPPAPEPALVVAYGLTPSSTPLERRLSLIAASFLTEDPDLAGLLSLSSILANAVSIAPESLKINQVTGAVSGQLEVSENMKGTFSYKDGQYKVELSTWDARAEFKRTLSMSFREDTGVARSANLTVRSLPDNNKAATSENLDGKEFIGWRAKIDPFDGAKVFRMATKIEDPDPLGTNYLFEVSDVPGLMPREMPELASTNAFDMWLVRLSSVRTR